ncbi:MAG: dipeptidase, partial [Blastocatellia bacterium]|nr:dipeptidase [Blastocatellia bacterium]
IQRVLDDGVDIGNHTSDGHVDIPKMKAGGLGVQFFSIWVQPKLYPGDKAIDRTWKMINGLKKQVETCQDLELATSPKEITEIISSGKIVAAMGIEGGHSIRGSIDLLKEYFEVGVRYMTLTWSNSNEICGSSGDSGKYDGLTKFGKEVVKLMNQMGMMVDISHVSDKAFFEVLEVSQKPPIVSHSNTRKLCNHPRNLTDDMLKVLAEHNGVCGINFYPLFLVENYHVEKKDATYKNVADHIDHAVNIAGIDHVAIGSDYDGIPSVPKGLEDISKLPNLVSELEKRGYKEDDINKLLYQNVMRVFEEVSNV